MDNLDTSTNPCERTGFTLGEDTTIIEAMAMKKAEQAESTTNTTTEKPTPEPTLKPSYYNFTFSEFGENDDTLVYNSRTGAMAVLDKESFNAFNNFCKNSEAVENEELLNSIKHCGFLIDTELSERDEIRLNMLSQRFSSSALALTIAPSMDCNFRCSYCFEAGSLHKTPMSDEVASKIVDLVSSRASQLSHLEVSWFGGEPLLDMERIESLSTDLMKVCEQYNINYKSDIITNGYFYTPEIAHRLKDCKVSKVQITIDGTKETHDQRRFLECGGGTFDTILQNLKDTKGILPVVIRINVDLDNREQVNDILSVLQQEELTGFVTPYLGHVEPYTDSCEGTNCLSTKQFGEYYLKFTKDNGGDITSIFPQPKSICCFADSNNAFAIDPYGDVYKCYADLGNKDKVIYSLLTEDTRPSQVYYNYVLFDPTNQPQCSACKMLPLCMGDCPSLKSQGKDSCARYKHNLDEHITECAKRILEMS